MASKPTGTSGNGKGETPSPARIAVRRQNGKIWSHLRKSWKIETPEEMVRQEYLLILLNEYGFTLDQMDEELEVTGRGSGHARADFVIWRSPQDKSDKKSPLIVVECKSDNVTIRAADYHQGDNYARLVNAPFFVSHNTRETRYWRVLKDRMPGYIEEIENIPHANATNKQIEELISKLKVFKEDEFADLLHQCHNVIRNREHRDPADAFDQIAKLLFVKVWVERALRAKKTRENLFTVEFLESQLADNPLNELFEQTKRHYRAARIFAKGDRIDLKPATGKEIVRLLEKYNLSDTSEDIKGIAFERFLGRTFRGEIGQFFTPRSIVEFMVRMVEPKEGDIICDPASGSGGFLIRFFEIVREQILADVDLQYQQYKKVLEKKKLSESKLAELLRNKFAELQSTIELTTSGSRMWKLANEYIFGTDANERMARTSKMNMIMHGDGHGGVHHHNGFINVNGIFEGRFDVILTNPPFGANVEPSDVLTEADVAVSEDDFDRYVKLYGKLYREAQARVEAAKGRPIANLFELPKGETSKVKTEILFVERCLTLLKPGGRLGIVLPEGVFNNPSLEYVRDFCEDRAFVRGVVSLKQEAFFSSGTSIKTSLLFLEKFTKEEKAEYDSKRAAAITEVDQKYAGEIAAKTRVLESEIRRASTARDFARRKEAEKALREYRKEMDEKKAAEARDLLKQRFDYPVFQYHAEKVGITATGEPDENELYPNERVPAHIDRTCIEHYREFRRDPSPYLLEGTET